MFAPNTLCALSVVICGYSDARWNQMLEAVASIRSQTLPAHDIILVVDHNPSLMARLAKALPDITVIENADQRGLSGARNTGVRATTGDIVAFLDDDATAAPDWLEQLNGVFDDPDVIAVGGRIEPLWEDARPAHFAEELDWIVGCTYRGMPKVAAEVRNVIGANMAFRRAMLERVGGFDTAMGRVGTLPLGCEETELCIRASMQLPSSRIVYEPAAVVHHHVPAARASAHYMLSRAWSEGVSKAQVARLVGRRRALHSERHYARVVLPRAFVAGLRDWRRRDGSGLRRSAMVLAVLTATTAGYTQGWMSITVRSLARVARSLPGASNEGEYEHAA
ncbi:glycosyltransferase family 2 protein [Rathayibacter soli]|uniref:glycosyltransferase family 2 protein n=1 Tax=Rathayibacter soli TaxID=3144168 RepID=UPI0027E4C08A|nr:glycosyltransferase [Glaciibacter superstes]